jgi:alanine-synthesizing transaminase
MFSARFPPESHDPSPLWLALESRRAAGAPVIDLTLSNPTLAGFAYPESIPALLASGVFPYRPTPQGDAAAREAIGGYYRARGRRCDAADLFLTASTSEAYAFLFKLLCDPGDEILIPSPTYPLFDALAGLEHVELVRYPLVAESGGQGTPWRADIGFLRSMVSTRTKALILVHPNNPTGHLAQADEVRAYLDLAAEYDFALIVDEVFSDYALGPVPYAAIVSDGPLVFTLNGFSKLLALPQLKLGWIHLGGAADKVAAAKPHLEWICDAFLSVNTPVQSAVPALLGLRDEIQGPILARLRANLAAARDLAAKSRAMRALIPEAGWSLVLDIAAAAADEAFCLTLLRDHGVYVHPGHLFGWESGCRLVVSLLGPEAEFRKGIAAIAALAEAGSHE